MCLMNAGWTTIIVGCFGTEINQTEKDCMTDKKWGMHASLTMNQSFSAFKREMIISNKPITWIQPRLQCKLAVGRPHLHLLSSFSIARSSCRCTFCELRNRVLDYWIYFVWVLFRWDFELDLIWDLYCGLCLYSVQSAFSLIKFC